MNSIALTVFSLCVVACFAAPPSRSASNTKQGGYTTKYDNINLDEILNNPKLVKNYINCLLSGTGCTPQGKELREHLPDALKTQCAKCTDAQRNGAIKVINKVQKDYPEDWKKLSEKWDPTGEYFKKLTSNIQTTSIRKH